MYLRLLLLPDSAFVVVSVELTWLRIRFDVHSKGMGAICMPTAPSAGCKVSWWNATRAMCGCCGISCLFFIPEEEDEKLFQRRKDPQEILTSGWRQVGQVLYLVLVSTIYLPRWWQLKCTPYFGRLLRSFEESDGPGLVAIDVQQEERAVVVQWCFMVARSMTAKVPLSLSEGGWRRMNPLGRRRSK